MITTIAAVVGMILGTAGFVMSLLAYRRDRTKIKVVLDWYLPTENTPTVRAYLRVINVGRRTFVLRRFGLCIPFEKEQVDISLSHSPLREEITEGHSFDHFLEGPDAWYGKKWYEIEAFAEDSMGKKYRSKTMHYSRELIALSQQIN